MQLERAVTPVGRYLLAAAAASLVLGACGAQIPAVPDAAPTDGDPPENGLSIAFSTDPPIPGMVGSELWVEELKVFNQSIRAIGDAAPGDVRTTRTNVLLEWDDEDSPAPFWFAEAPSGRYATIELRIAPRETGSAAFQIEGAVDIAGVMERFEIGSETGVISVDVPVESVLSPGTITSITISLSVSALVSGIDFSAVPVDEDGVHVIDDDRPEMAGIRDRLAGAFSSVGGSLD